MNSNGAIYWCISGKCLVGAINDESNDEVNCDLDFGNSVFMKDHYN